MIQVLTNPATLPRTVDSLSIVSYNVLLPNSVDGWWTYKMYSPPLADEQQYVASWDHRKGLLKDRLATMDADVVCFQEVAPASFEDDFEFMQELGYNGVEMFKKGRFRPATFWKTSIVELASPPVHKDRTLLTSFRRKDKFSENSENWYVLNCHLQAGKQAQRRVRQINDGVKAVMTLARKQKEKDPEKSVRLVVCGDFNGGDECGALHYLSKGYVDDTFIEDGDPVTSSKKALPLSTPLRDIAKAVERDPPPTLVVPELISQMVEGNGYENPQFSEEMIRRLTSIYGQLATYEDVDGTKKMNLDDVEKWLKLINLELGRGSEFREAAKQMGWKDPNPESSFEEKKARIRLPQGGLMTLEGFVKVYDEELKAGKFWGIAHDVAVLGEPLPYVGIFEARFDRMYYSAAIQPLAILDSYCDEPCPNRVEPSDHLPVAAVFRNELGGSVS